MRFLSILVLSLLLSGCKTTSGTLYQNQYGISFVDDDNRSKIIEQNIASNNCAKFGKFAFKFSGAYVDNAVNYQCFQNYTENYGDQKLIWTNFNNHQQTSSNLNSIINSNKKRCIQMGFKEETEKLADCVLRLVEIEDAKQTNQIQKQRNSEAALAAMLGAVVKSTTSNNTPKRTCFKTGEEVGGFNKICRYNCVGNLVTTTIGSMQFCPLTIQR